MSPPSTPRSRGRRLGDGRHQFRLAPDDLMELHPAAEDAAAHGDYAWITRFATGDAELAGLALLVMGNPVGAARRLSTAPAGARRDLFRTLVDWVESGESGDAAACLAAAPPTAERDALAALLDRGGPQQVLFVGGPMDRIAETAARFEGVWAAVGRPDPETGGVVVHPTVDEPPPLGSDREFDLIFVDPSHWLPHDLDAFRGPAVGFIGDLEWHFAHAPFRYRRFDALMALGSQGALEAATRFRRPAFVGPIAAHIGLQTVDAAFLGPQAGRAWLSRSRPLDVVATGRQRHVAGLYFDKPVVNRALLACDERYAVKLLNGFLDESEYRAVMASARFVIASHRFALGQSWKVFEALGAGAMAIVDAASGAQGRFSEDFGVIHAIRSHALDEDLARHLDTWPRYAERFAARAEAFFAELASLVPPPERGAAQFLRAVRLGVALSTLGTPDAALRRWRRPDPASAPAPDGAGADAREPVIQSYILARSALGWLERPARDGADYAEALGGLARTHLRRALGRETDETLAADALALSDRFPRHGLPRFLHAAALWPAGTGGAAAALQSLSDEIDDLRFEVFDGRPEWRIPPLVVGDLVDAAMRDALGGPETQAETPALRAAISAMTLALRAGDALRRGNHREAAEWAAAALSRRADLAYAAGTLLQARRRFWLARNESAAAAAFLDDFQALGDRDETLFHMFGWTAMRLLLATDGAPDALSVARRWVLQWARSGRDAPGRAIPRWASPDPQFVWNHPEIRAILQAGGFDLEAAAA